MICFSQLRKDLKEGKSGGSDPVWKAVLPLFYHIRSPLFWQNDENGVSSFKVRTVGCALGWKSGVTRALLVDVGLQFSDGCVERALSLPIPCAMVLMT